MNTIAIIVEELSKPITEKNIRHRKQGGSTLSYIEWHTACVYLDRIAPGWSWTIVSITEIAGLTVVHGSLTIPSSDGVTVREATGIEDSDSKGYGDVVSNASAMAFKRAAAMFGLGRHLYSKQKVEVEDYISPAMPSAPVQASQISPQNAEAVVELIQLLKSAGIDNQSIQQRMKVLTGVDKRKDLTDATAVKLIREFEDWINIIEQEQTDLERGSDG